MHSFDNGFLIVCLIIIGFVLINCEKESDKDESDIEKDDDITPEDLYSFVALIDVVFTDGMKKTCTGTIIHDYVVITAAHCFKVDEDNIIQAELTASFVVIGTKKMFDTGYEQYLPIERVIIHPNYSGWTADLSLVYTFAGMMSDKPGRIVPLGSEKTSTPGDSDVTVFSWGQYKKSNNISMVPSNFKKWSKEEKYDSLKGQMGRIRKQKVTSPLSLKSNSEEDIDGQTSNGNQKITKYILWKSSSEEDISGRIGRMGNQKVVSDNKLKSIIDESIEQFSPTSHKFETSKTSPKENKRQRQRRKKKKNRKIIRQRKQSIGSQVQYHLRQSPAEIRSKYRHRPLRYGNMAYFNSEADQLSWKKNKDNLNRFYAKIPTTRTYRSSKQFYRATSYYRNNWRRKMGDQQNKLSVEIFGFVNMQKCKKIIDTAMTSYEIKNPNEVLCYASEEHYISEEDSGAPAMRRGRLIAVTVGGVELDGERVAIGMKMTCFCSWIYENIPTSGTTWECCKHCCEPKNETEQNHLHFGHAHPPSKSRSKS